MPPSRATVVVGCNRSFLLIGVIVCLTLASILVFAIFAPGLIH